MKILALLLLSILASCGGGGSGGSGSSSGAPATTPGPSASSCHVKIFKTDSLQTIAVKANRARVECGLDEEQVMDLIE